MIYTNTKHVCIYIYIHICCREREMYIHITAFRTKVGRPQRCARGGVKWPSSESGDMGQNTCFWFEC